MKRTLLTAVLVAASALAACGKGDQFSSRDFNELIPRLMKSVAITNPTEAASKLFDTTSPDERRDAIAYLQTKKYGHEAPYMKAYRMLATDPSPMVRGQALRALGSSHDYSVVDVLARGMADKEASVREDAAWGLRTTYTDLALDPLTAHLKVDDSDQVRIHAAAALQWSSTPKAIRTLIEAIDDNNSAVGYNAYHSLLYITHQSIPQESHKWLAWYQQTYEPKAATQKAG